MPSFADSAVIFILALMLFGPKKLPQLARQLGKLMAEFRRASNEFRMQMEDELRIEEQKEHQAKVDAMAGPPSTLPDPEHPHLPSATTEADPGSLHDGTAPIAEAGGLRMMPPSTGLPVESATWGTKATGEDVGQPDSFAAEHSATEHTPIPEHSIAPPAIAAGMSSDEPVRDAAHQEAVQQAEQQQEQTHA